MQLAYRCEKLLYYLYWLRRLAREDRYTTNDGINLSAHFGRCRQFLIFEAGNGQVKLVETRMNAGCHGHGLSDGAAEHPGHSGFVEALRDCETVFVRRNRRGRRGSPQRRVEYPWFLSKLPQRGNRSLPRFNRAPFGRPRAACASASIRTGVGRLPLWAFRDLKSGACRLELPFREEIVMALMKRRDLLKAAAMALGSIRESRAAADTNRQINTVLGPIPPSDLGPTLIHEHVLVDIVGAGRIAPGRYDGGEVAGVVLPHLKQLRSQGCRTFVDCTPAYLGRDPALLARLAQSSGLHILTNTGFYGAAGGKYVPEFAFSATAEDLAARWTGEFEAGIPPTGIRPAPH